MIEPEVFTYLKILLRPDRERPETKALLNIVLKVRSLAILFGYTIEEHRAGNCNNTLNKPSHCDMMGE